MINAYDFDETIYDGDSTRDFYFFCLKRHLGVIFFLPYQAFWFLMFILGIIRKTLFKEKFYIFFRAVGNIDSELEEFWKTHEKNLKKWYLEQKKDTDVIISASPEFLLSPICKKLGIRLIASRVDRFTGKYDGENCYGNEKVIRFKNETDEEIDKFYSDSYSDTPLAKLAQTAYIVRGDKITRW